MSKKIEVGEYVRTLDGNIGKIEQINKEPTDISITYIITDSFVGCMEEVVNHDEDIAKLIGYGDFINNKMCIDIEHYTRDDGTPNINFVCLGGCVLKENIKSIVTKEQFKEMEYKV